MKIPRIAIVHEWLVNYAGSEKVLEQMLHCFPDADLFAVVDHLEDRGFVMGKRATTTFIQKLPMSAKRFRSYLPLMPLAIEQLDLSGYDLILSSAHAVAKGVLVGPEQLHISYVHSPIRYAWDLQHQYLRESGLDKKITGWLARWILYGMRNWDSRTANNVDHFISNSQFIKRRIHRVYRRDADVIYPPVDVESFPLRESKESFYLTASRMVPYKKMDVIVEAFNAMPHRRLKVIGNGPDMAKIRAKAGPNVEVLGYQPSAVLREHMQAAKAFVFAAEEDFGITPVEAQACGTPVIAYGRGGSLETVVGFQTSKGKPPTGVFFHEQSAAAILEAIDLYEENEAAFTPENCRQHALQFTIATFREKYKAFVLQKWEAHQASRDA